MKKYSRVNFLFSFIMAAVVIGLITGLPCQLFGQGFCSALFGPNPFMSSSPAGGGGCEFGSTGYVFEGCIPHDEEDVPDTCMAAAIEGTCHKAPPGAQMTEEPPPLNIEVITNNSTEPVEG